MRKNLENRLPTPAARKSYRAATASVRSCCVLLSCVLALLAACGKKEAEKEKAPPPVQVTAVSQATIQRIVSGDGALFPIDQANLMPKITAPVQHFYVNRGDHVKRGQLLGILENRDLVAAAAESQGAVEQAESNLRTTEVSTV